MTQISREDLLLLLVYFSRVLVGSSDQLPRSVYEAQEYNRQAMEHWQQANFLRTSYELQVSGLFNANVDCQLIWDDLETLKRQGLVYLERSDSGELDAFQVTAKGEDRAKKIEVTLSEPVRNHLSGIVQARKRDERCDRM